MPDCYVKQVLNGDKEAFRFIIRECKDDAYNLAISILKEEYAAKEAVQRAFIKAYEGLSKFRGDAAFNTWFYRIVVNESYQMVRNRKPDRNHLFNEREIDKSENNEVEKKIDEDHKEFFVRKALAQLSSNESLSLKLFYLHDYSIQEICDITGWSDSNTKVTLHRARKSMKAQLQQIDDFKQEEL